MKTQIFQSKLILLGTFIFLATSCRKEAISDTQSSEDSKTFAQNEIESLSSSNTAAIANVKTYTLKVSSDLPDEIKLLLNGKAVKEGENKFKLSSGYYLDIIITKGVFEKSLLLSNSQTSSAITDLTTGRKKVTGSTVLSACDIAYSLCRSNCPANGPGAADCGARCLIDWNSCQIGPIKSPYSGVVLL